MVLRIMTPFYQLNQDVNFPEVDESSSTINFFDPNSYVYNFTLGPIVDARANHGALIRILAAEATVLLKNVNNTLPLKSPKNIGIFGNDASEPTEGLYFLSLSAANPPKWGVLAAGGGSGTVRFSYLITPLEVLKARGLQDNTLVQYFLDNDNIPITGLSNFAPTPPDVCLVFIKSFATEGGDRLTLLADWNSTAVVNTVASACTNTVVIIHGTGPVVMPWADHENVTAILHAHFPGEQAGNSIVDVLYGDVNPSGHLPYTVAKKESDYQRNLLNSTELQESTENDAWQADFTEGQLTDYRYFDAKNMSVAYEFGFGLSYTSFAVSNLAVVCTSQSIPRTPSENATVLPGGNEDLWKTVAVIHATVTNTGPVTGKTVPQLYVSLGSEAGAGTPVRSLRGFDKVSLDPGQKATVSFPLMRRDVSYWDIVKQSWVIPSSGMSVSVGLSSRDLPLQAELNI
jgi:beta-glucosidase